MNIPWILTSIALFIFGGIALYIGASPEVRFYLSSSEGSGQLVITMLAVSIGTLGIVWSFHAETERTRRLEANTFKRTFAALLEETANNYAAIKKLKSAIKPKQFNFLTLSTEIARSITANPLTYKYTGTEYTLALGAYLTSVELANKWLSFVWEDFRADGSISENNIADLNRQLEDCKYYLLILQIQNQLYVHVYNVQMGPSPANSGEIRAWLMKKTPITIEDLETKLREMDQLEAKKVKELRKGLQAVIKD